MSLVAADSRFRERADRCSSRATAGTGFARVASSGGGVTLGTLLPVSNTRKPTTAPACPFPAARGVRRLRREDRVVAGNAQLGRRRFLWSAAVGAAAVGAAAT